MRRLHILTVAALLTLAAPLAGPALADADAERPTAELKRDLKETRGEHEKFADLRRKLDSAGRQSANAARASSVDDMQAFMKDCILRRERELGDVMTIKQHGEMVRAGTTGAGAVGAPVPANGGMAPDGPQAHRVRQLTNMKSLYVTTKQNARPAVERQEGAYERYLAAVDRFGGELAAGVSRLTNEIAAREAPAETAAAD